MSNMDYVLRITDNTSGTVTLTSDPFDVRDYHPRTADRKDPTLAETITVRVQDGSSPNNLDEIRTANRLLRQAEKAQEDRAVNKVYLEFSPDGTVSYWRSEIVKARGQFTDTTFKYAHWYGNTHFADLLIERSNWWEGPEAQVPLTNGNGTANTSGLNVFNANDAAGTAPTLRYMFVQVPGTAVLGDLPGATRLEMTAVNRTGGTPTYDYLWIGQNWTTPTTFNPILQGEAGIITTGGSTSSTDAAASNAAYGYHTALSGVDTPIFQWTMGTAAITAAGGRYYKTFLMMHGASNAAVPATYFQWTFEDPTFGLERWSSSVTRPDTGDTDDLTDMQTIPVPPWLSGMGSIGSTNLILNAYQTTYGTATYNLDYAMLLPTDGYRAYALSRMTSSQRLVDDGIDERVYLDDGSGASRVGITTEYAAPLRLEPNTTQRIWFINSNSTGSLEAGFTVKLYYRPRRLSI